jgi:hypothetical protein
MVFENLMRVGPSARCWCLQLAWPFGLSLFWCARASSEHLNLHSTPLSGCPTLPLTLNTTYAGLSNALPVRLDTHNADCCNSNFEPKMSNDDSEVTNKGFAEHPLFPWLVTLALAIVCLGVIWMVSLLLR